MNICRKCGAGKFHECSCFDDREEKVGFFKKKPKTKPLNRYDCPCTQIINEDTHHFKDKLGPDQRSNI